MGAVLLLKNRRRRNLPVPKTSLDSIFHVVFLRRPEAGSQLMPSDDTSTLKVMPSGSAPVRTRTRPKRCMPAKAKVKPASGCL
ncbi:hypothetical protein D3C72_669880 [compost metagenome]